MLLKRFLTRDACTAVPPLPYFPERSQSSRRLPPTMALAHRRTISLEAELEEQLSLSQFRLPPARHSHSPAGSASSSPSSPTSPRWSQASQNIFVEAVYYAKPQVYGESITRKDEPRSAVLIDDTAMQLSHVQSEPAQSLWLPTAPTPVVLDLDSQMESERFEYDT